ncbi:hypothetical protein AC578_3185 [Pseudocercospora eumusae]|uniref:Uncharacterized protein n=1 Tax=Pseudocercospora eumusae TaxID=321146 RepID=A0A139GWE3_9PEZI|nr:hypothetical protein AC578_3185 [Pseudocercospora eumusae]
MGTFIEIKFLPAPKNDAESQDSGRKLKSMAGSAQKEVPGFKGAFSGRPLQMQEVVEILDGKSPVMFVLQDMVMYHAKKGETLTPDPVWDSDSSWRAKEESPDQEQIRKLLDGLCEHAALDLSLLAAFKNQYFLNKEFSPATDGTVTQMALFLLPLDADQADFADSVTRLFGTAEFTAGWGLSESMHDALAWRTFLMLSKWENVASCELAWNETEPALHDLLHTVKAKVLRHHIKWMNPFAKAGLAVSGGLGQKSE